MNLLREDKLSIKTMEGTRSLWPAKPCRVCLGEGFDLKAFLIEDFDVANTLINFINILSTLKKIRMTPFFLNY